MISLDAEAVVIEISNIVLCGGVPPARPPAIEAKGGRIILLDANAILVDMAEPGLPLAVAGLCGLPKPAQRSFGIAGLALGTQEVCTKRHLRLVSPASAAGFKNRRASIGSAGPARPGRESAIAVTCSGIALLRRRQ